jgi:hypothetical protein
MRSVLLVAALGAAVIAAATPTHAQSPYTYRWCALNGDRSGATSCYFETRAQCEATLSGIGGSCIRSPYNRDDRRRWR